jgi:predicted nucleic acid-binding protein
MAVKVVDASAVAAVVFGEPEAAIILPQLAGVSLAAPNLLVFEIGNICFKKIRRFPERRAQLLAALGFYSQMSVDMQNVDLEQVVHLADRAGLTAYDASYLWLARELDVELVTLDARLDTAARRISRA